MRAPISMRRGHAALAFVAAVSVVVGMTPAGGARQSNDPASRRPNILLIVTDDQRIGTFDAMPAVRRYFRDGGRTYKNAYATSPLCCPSRTSIMTGRYPHNHEVRRNEDALNLAQDSTLQYYLKSNGYNTALSGKYLNAWPETETPPPHFDYFAAIDDEDYGSVYYDFVANVNGAIRHPKGYSTKFVRDKAKGFIRRFEASDRKPWFLYVAPFAPHKPFHPERRYLFANTPRWDGNPAVDETDRSDKPPWVQQRSVRLWGGRDTSRRQYRTLKSVDDMVASLFATLNRLDETRDTLAIFMSDNGYLWGEHGLASKRFPYTGAVKIPLAIRWPGRVARGSTDDRMAANIDLAPTILDVLGIAEDPRYPMDGRSVFDATKRDKLLMEYFGARLGNTPPWFSMRSDDYQYVEYYDETIGTIQFREYYDLRGDRWQLTNLLADGDPLNDPSSAFLTAELAQLRDCRGDECP